MTPLGNSPVKTGPWLLLTLVLLLACRAPVAIPEGAIRLGDDVYVEPLAEGVWRHVSFGLYSVGPYESNGLIVATTEGALMVDTAWDPEQTAWLLSWAAEAVGPVVAVVVTHAHDDRMGGISAVHARGIPSLALRATAERAAEKGERIERPVDSGQRLDAFGVGGEIFFPGAAHTTDNAVVYLEASRVLVGGCMVRSAAATGLGNVAEGDLASWPEAVRRLQARYPEVARVLPGHGAPGDASLLQHTLSLLGATPE